MFSSITACRPNCNRLRQKLKSTHTAALSPFDPVVWDRKRASELFGFDYRIECYTPAAKRRFGYFVLPLLNRGRLVGRMDAKAHRSQGVFEIKNLYLEPGIRPTRSYAAIWPPCCTNWPPGMARHSWCCSRGRANWPRSLSRLAQQDFAVLDLRRDIGVIGDIALQLRCDRHEAARNDSTDSNCSWHSAVKLGVLPGSLPLMPFSTRMSSKAGANSLLASGMCCCR
jgi:hypothetical protein